MATKMIVERVITVEYLEPSMSRELAGKFPDESAFGFDYSQSGIWSPLLPHSRRASTSMLCKEVQKVLIGGSFAKIVKKKKMKAKDAAMKRLEFSPDPSPKGRWNRLLRAAAKCFKAQRRLLQMSLPNL